MTASAVAGSMRAHTSGSARSIMARRKPKNMAYTGAGPTGSSGAARPAKYPPPEAAEARVLERPARLGREVGHGVDGFEERPHAAGGVHGPDRGVGGRRSKPPTTTRPLRRQQRDPAG